MKRFSLPTLYIRYLLCLPWLLMVHAAPTARSECVPWRLDPTRNPLQDIRNVMPRASDGKQNGDLYTAITVMVAVQNRVPLRDFIQALVMPGHDFCSDYDEHRIGINAIKGNLPPGVNENGRPDIVISKSELDFAWIDKEHTPIWPVVVRKALEAIDVESSDPEHTLLVKMGRREDTFDCNKDGLPYLCKVSDMVSRLTGVRLHVTEPVLMEDTPQANVDIEQILNGAAGGIGIIFDNQAPRFLMHSSADNKDREYKQKAFNAAQLDIEKYGERDETNYNVYGFGTGTFTYDSIMDRHGGEHRDVRLVVPY